MKYLILLLSLMFCGVAFADGGKPKYLDGANVTVTLKDGKTYSFNSDEWKVVPRVDKVPAAPAVTEEQETEVAATIVVTPIQPELKRNRIRLMGGVGPQGVKEDTYGVGGRKFSLRDGDVEGLGYDRLLNETISLGGQALTNGTYLLDLGLDF